ncbi:MAG: hypothetical protein KF709_13285 [Gemmatimonadaceae bacterium]|nr:hypothetical protein [Gemmatimonadaceae bacterium]
MSDVPRSHRVISVLITIWMSLGVVALAMDPTMSEAARAQLTDAQRQLNDARPMWLMIVYGIATIGGLLGAIGLVVRKRWAVPALTISLAAVVVQFGTILFVLDAIALLGAATAVPFPLVICVLGAASLWYGMRAQARGWLS